MKLNQITIKNVKSFIEGYSKALYNDLIGLPDHMIEQITYRHTQCPDCIEKQECKHCGCNPIKKAFVKKSCNGGERFPDIMEKEDWGKYKKENDIQ